MIAILICQFDVAVIISIINIRNRRSINEVGVIFVSNILQAREEVRRYKRPTLSSVTVTERMQHAII